MVSLKLAVGAVPLLKLPKKLRNSFAIVVFLEPVLPVKYIMKHGSIPQSRNMELSGVRNDKPNPAYIKELGATEGSRVRSVL
ncbi:MAG: hypothetical protein PUH30_11065, partial [Oscillospiraceae bacterium]|nr:hypothetical protein [Oscillospiraceae bacterium]